MQSEADASEVVQVVFVMGPWDGRQSRRPVDANGLPPAIIRARSSSSPTRAIRYYRCEQEDGDEVWFYVATEEIPH